MKYVKVKDLGQIVTGNTPPTSDMSNYGDFIPFIKATDIILGSRYTYITEQGYSLKSYKKYKANLIPKGSTCIVTIGSIGKKMTQAHTDLFVNQAINAILPYKEYDKDYIYYVTKFAVLPQLKIYDSGTTSGRENISKSSFSNIRLYVEEDIHTQQKIASILSSYDRLIEYNTRRIHLLEQMAENLYKEWFAYHKIKGQSTAVKLKEFVSITRGLSYSSEEIDCTDGNNLINLKNIQGYGGFRLEGTKLYNGKYKPEQIVEEGDLIMGVTDMTQDRRTVGSVALIPNVKTLSVISADLVKINSSIDNTYLYAMFRYGNVSRHIAQFANGANVLHLRPKSILNIKVILPNQDIIDSFVSKVKPMIHLTNRLNTEIDSLTRQRDLLLPRLMSGKLEVKS